jgi:hypothetical protein
MEQTPQVERSNQLQEQALFELSQQNKTWMLTERRS